MARVLRLPLVAACALAWGAGTCLFSSLGSGCGHRLSPRRRCLPTSEVEAEERQGTSLEHRAPRGKAAALPGEGRRGSGGPRNEKVALNNLVSKTVRRSLLSGDIVYDMVRRGDGPEAVEATVRVQALEDGDRLEFKGVGQSSLKAQRAAAAAALAALPPPPDIEPRYPRPEVAAAWLAKQLRQHSPGDTAVELDSTMADLLPTMANLPANLRATARYALEDEHPCRVQLRSSTEVQVVPAEEVRSMTVSGRTIGGKLAAAMRARLLGEDGERSWRCLELKLAGKSASRETAIAMKILQRFLPEDVHISFKSRFEQFEGYRARGMVVTVVRTEAD